MKTQMNSGWQNPDIASICSQTPHLGIEDVDTKNDINLS